MNPVPEHLSLLLSCYLDGELTDIELSEVVAALETDVEAIAEFRRLQGARRVIRTLPTLQVPLALLPGGHLGEELSAYLDGELATGEMPNVVAHLAGCDDCRMELAALDRSRSAVRSLPGVEPPTFLDVAREERRRRSVVLWPAAVAGGIAVVALAFTVTVTRSGTQPASVDLADLQSRHAAVASVPSNPVGFEVSNP